MDPISIINTVLLTAISIGIGAVYRAIGDLQRQVGVINGRVTRLEEFRTTHESWDRERNDRNEREHAEMDVHHEITRKTVHRLRNEVFAAFLKARLTSGMKPTDDEGGPVDE